ncbi:MAG TPA: hypothetical protein VJ890_21235, partial [Vineibacter sp.]|nr:hypothetical protein [Vineibacter sp.]
KIFAHPIADLMDGLLSHHRGTTAPDWAVPGMIWEDISGGVTAVAVKMMEAGGAWRTLGILNETSSEFLPGYFGTTQRALARNTAGAGLAELVTISQMLNWQASVARGDLTMRGASDWARLPPGALDTILSANGAGADLSYKTLSALMDAVIGGTQGQIAYRNGSVWTALAAGTSGFFLRTNGGGANPSWNQVDQPIKQGGIVDNGTMAASYQVAGLQALGARHLLFFGKAYPATNGATITVRLLDGSGTTLAGVTGNAANSSGSNIGAHFVGFAPQILDGAIPQLLLGMWSNGGAIVQWSAGVAAAIVDQVQMVASGGNVSGNLQVYFTP